MSTNDYFLSSSALTLLVVACEIVPEMTYFCVGWDVKPYPFISVICLFVCYFLCTRWLPVLASCISCMAK